MIEYDGFGPEKILTVYSAETGMRGIVGIDNTVSRSTRGGFKPEGRHFARHGR